jgi:hypothetical protein
MPTSERRCLQFPSPPMGRSIACSLPPAAAAAAKPRRGLNEARSSSQARHHQLLGMWPVARDGGCGSCAGEHGCTLCSSPGGMCVARAGSLLDELRLGTEAGVGREGGRSSRLGSLPNIHKSAQLTRCTTRAPAFGVCAARGGSGLTENHAPFACLDPTPRNSSYWSSPCTSENERRTGTSMLWLAMTTIAFALVLMLTL